MSAAARRAQSAQVSRVPAGRIERFLRLGVAAGGMAAGAAVESARRWWSGETASVSDVVLHPANARRLAKTLARMRGAAMKMGQLLSLEGGSLLPPQFAEVLTVLQDSAHTMSESELNALLGREYGRGWQKRFRELEVAPMASASIGQVHRALTVDGRALALKVQFPGIRRSVASDVDNVVSLLRIARIVPEAIDIRPLVDVVKRQLLRETDYVEEAANLSRFRKLLEDEPRLVVPGVHMELTTKRVLAMDLVVGTPLAELAKSATPQARRDEVGALIQGLVLRELFDFGWMQSDPNIANFIYLADERALALLDFGSTVPVSEVLKNRYRRLLRATIERDDAVVAELAIEFGWVDAGERSDRIEGLAELLVVACEPLRARGSYDFGASDLPQRVQALSLELAFKRGLLKPPPPELVFSHRKLAGSYLVCARLGARVASGRLAARFLA